MTYPANRQPIQNQSKKALSESEATTLLARLQWRATHQRDRVAYQFLADQPVSVAQSDLSTWTYGELYERVQIIANALSQHNGVVGQPVLLVYPPGLELIAAFLSCLSAGAIATLVPPPRRHESLARWQHIMADANVAGVLTTQALLGTIEPLMTRSPAATPLCWLTTDIITPQSTAAAHSTATNSVVESADRAGDNCSCAALSGKEALKSHASDDIAFLQYTSGSTSQPKGVIVTHANIAHNLQQIQQSFGHSADTRCVIWLPPYHDMGLIGGILQPLYGGYPVTLMSPTSFLRRPLRWLEAISYFGGTTSGGPNFAYDYCVQKISPEQCQSLEQPLDLSSWSVAFTGAEPVQANTLNLFAEKFSRCGFSNNAFYPCYGLAESTLFVTGGEATAPPKVISISQSALKQGEVRQIVESANQAAERVAKRTAVEQAEKQRAVPSSMQVVSCGQAATQHIEIVDPQTLSPCEPHQIGEIWVAGDSVAAGYWGRVKATQKAFDNRLEGQTRSFLRTGDLGFLFSGELFVTGRLKDLIVIRGQNYYPQDIEISIRQAHASLHPAAAVFSVSAQEAQSNQEQLVIVQELSRTAVRQIRKQTLSASAIVEAIKACVSQQHGLQVWAVVLLKPGALPKTTSGKVKRQACKAAFNARTLDSIYQWPERLPERLPEKSPEKSPYGANKHSTHGTHDQASSGENSDLEKTNQLLTWLQAYARDSINSRLMDERRCISPSIILDFGNKGLLGMQVPKRYGGLALNNQSMLRVIEQLGAIDPTLALFVGLNNVLGIRPILNYAPHELKEQLLPQLATGRELAAFALTEAGAGSHPFGIRSQAAPTETGWQLQGEKIWSGSAAWAGVTTVFAQQVNAAGEPTGISAFAVKKGTPGLRQGPEALTMGMRGMVQNTVRLENVPVSAAQRLGEAGKGMLVAQDAMMYGRLAIASACVGGMKRCAQLMLRYSQRRTISTGKLLDNPVMQTRLNWVVNAIAATESLVTLTATRLDSGLHVPEEIYAACKIAGPEFYWQAADHLVQCLGARGYIETNLAPQILRDARVLRIFEGPTESLAMYLGSRIVNQPESLSALFENLAQPKISSLLFESADWILAHYLSEKSPFSEGLSARRQAHFTIGKIATWAILQAALTATSASAAAIEWSQAKFEQAVKQALQTQPDEALNIAETLESIEHYQQSIGDIE
ncbi:MAG: AMP-binding protein, partial [Cyanobacteria bacterium J06598_3]